MASRETIAQILIILGESYPRHELTENTAVVYQDLLSDVDDAVLVTAVKQHVADGKWFPTIAELRVSARFVMGRETGLPTAQEALNEVMKMMSHIGSNVVLDTDKPPQWTNPLIADVLLSMGGYRAFCLSEDGMADRAHFMRLYDQRLEREKREDSTLPEVRAAIKQAADRMKMLKGDSNGS